MDGSPYFSRLHINLLSNDFELQYYDFDDKIQNQQQIMIANLKTLRQKLTCNVRLAQILAMRM